MTDNGFTGPVPSGREMDELVRESPRSKAPDAYTICPVCDCPARWVVSPTTGQSTLTGGAEAVCIGDDKLYLHEVVDTPRPQEEALHDQLDDSEHHFSITNDVTVYYVEPRYPTETPLLEATPRDPVKLPYMDASQWHFVFAINDFSRTPRLDGDGPHAVLRDIYGYTDDGKTLLTAAVNGSTKIPYAVLDAVAQREEVVGFGRPPYIPERDDEDGNPENLPFDL